MCYGAQDAKYMVRDIEQRMKNVAFVADKSETPLEKPLAGPLVWLRGLFGRKPLKDLVNG